MTKSLKVGADEESLSLTAPETTCEEEAISCESKATKRDRHITLIEKERERVGGTCQRRLRNELRAESAKNLISGGYI